MSDFSFKKAKNFEERLKESEKIKEKYPDRIPVIIEKSVNSSVNNINKHKYLVPSDLTVGQFIHVIRKRIQAQPEQGIFIFVKEKILPPTSSLMITMYENYADSDGFLYMIYSSENTFGK
jgi:GABA(A) receptor-associated protein